MKFLLGALALIAATSTWAQDYGYPEDIYGQTLREGSDGRIETIDRAPAVEYGTRFGLVIGHDGELSTYETESYDADDEFVIDDYSDY